MIDLQTIPKISGIYKFTNKINNKVYIGQAVNLRSRIGGHFRDYKLNKKNKHFYNSIQKYGLENFEVQILVQEKNLTKQELDDLEIDFIRFYNSNNQIFGYNMTAGGEGGIPNDETRKKLSEAAKNRKPISEETRQKMKNKKHSQETIEKRIESRKWYKHSEETKQKLKGRKHSEESKEKMKGKIVSQETREKLSKANKGKIVSEQTKQKLREANLGKKLTEEHKQKMSFAQTGRKLSQEHIQILKQSNLNRVISEQTKQKMSQSQKGKKLKPESIEKRTRTQKLNRFKKLLTELFYIELIKI